MPENNPSPLAETPLTLFAAHGIEVEYMLVDGERLDVAPAADALQQQQHRQGCWRSRPLPQSTPHWHRLRARALWVP